MSYSFKATLFVICVARSLLDLCCCFSGTQGKPPRGAPPALSLSHPKSPALRAHEDRKLSQAPDGDEKLTRITRSFRTILECLGEDPARAGLLKTPQRAAKALAYFTKGYETTLEDMVNDAIFDEDCDEMVIVRDINIFSLCEHHLVPFLGQYCGFACVALSLSLSIHPLPLNAHATPCLICQAKFTLGTSPTARCLGFPSLPASLRCLVDDCRFKSGLPRRWRRRCSLCSR